MENCLSHSPRYRGRLEYVFNSLRISGDLPHRYATRVVPVLCTCTDSLSVNSFWKDDNKLSELVDDAIENVKCKLKSLIHSETFSQRCVLQIAAILDSTKKSKTQISSLGLTKFIIILEKIFDQKFDLFESVNEKENKTKQKTHQLKLDSKYVGLLIGKRGQNLASVGKLSDCAIHVDRKGADKREGTVVMTILGKQDGYQIACELLDKEALEVTRKRAIHEERVREHDRVRDKIRMARLLARGKEMVSRGVIEDIKNSNRNEYERQLHARPKVVDEEGFTTVVNRKRNGTKVKGHKLLAEGSRCLNCGEPYRGDNISQACKYHPGFVVDKKWKCCDHVISVDQLTPEEHRTTGCASSVHNFRPTQKRSGKANLNSSMESSTTLTKEGKDILQDVKRKNRKYRRKRY